MTNTMTNNITESRMIELIQEELLNKISEIQLTSLLGSNEVTKLSLLNEAFPGGVVAQKNGPPVGKWNIQNIKYITEKTISDLDNPKKWELEYIDWRKNKGAWLEALEYVAVGTMGLAALFGGPVLIAGATVSAFFIAAIETPYVVEAFRRGKYGLAALRAIYAYAGLLVRGFRALKALTQGAPPAVVAVVESAQLTLKQNLLKVSKELAETGILMGAVYSLFTYSPQFKKAYDVTVKAYATSICRGETGTFDQIKGRNESPECVDPEIAQYFDRPNVQRKVMMWDIENDEEAVAEREKVKKEIKSVADEIDEPLGTTNENVFYENRFSKLAGI